VTSGVIVKVKDESHTRLRRDIDVCFCLENNGVSGLLVFVAIHFPQNTLGVVLPLS